MWTALCDKYFRPLTGTISLWISFAFSHFAHKNHNKTLLFGSILHEYNRHFDYWNPFLILRISYLDCHETGLCCYLVIHIENLLRPLQLFYFILWPIYWLTCHLEHLNGMLKKSLSSVLPILETPRLLSTTRNITWIPERIVMKLDMHISCHLGASQRHISYFLPVTNTNTTYSLSYYRDNNLNITWMP
jgi:hypothetical protein